MTALPWHGVRTGYFPLVAIDPGKRTCAVAVAAGIKLAGVGLLPSLSKLYPVSLLSANAVVWEIPEQRGGAGAPAEDLIWLAAAGADMARAIALDAPVRHRTPSQWKGSVPKPVHHTRLLDTLTGAELDLLGGPAAIHRAVDAACRRGAAKRWAKPGATYYRKGDMPVGITHDMLDAAALLMFELGRLRK